MKTILESINTISIIQNAIKISISRLLCVGRHTHTHAILHNWDKQCYLLMEDREI